MRKILKIIFGLLMGTVFFSTGFLVVRGQGSVVISVSPSTQSAEVGDEVTVSINISGVTALYSCQISLTYNSSILEYKESLEGTFLNENGATQTFSIQPRTSFGSVLGFGVMRLGQVGGLDGSGTLATFKFTAVGAGTSQITLETSQVGIEGIKLVNPSLDLIPYSTQNGQVTISAPVVAKPSLTLTKAVDKASAEAGDTLTYTITYKNIGTAEAKSVVITDTIPANTTYVSGSATQNGTVSGGQVTWDIGSVPTGVTGNVSFKVKINS